jgi:hypothetical protein
MELSRISPCATQSTASYIQNLRLEDIFNQQDEGVNLHHEASFYGWNARNAMYDVGESEQQPLVNGSVTIPPHLVLSHDATTRRLN